MANKLYLAEETSTIWGSEVGDDLAMTTESLADGSGRQGAQLDLGVAPRADRHNARHFGQCVATATLGGLLEWYRKTGDGTHYDNDDGTGDIAVSADDKLRNLLPLPPSIVDEAAANIEYGRGNIEIKLLDRYVMPVLQNESGAATTADDSETKFILTPMPPELQ